MIKLFHFKNYYYESVYAILSAPKNGRRHLEMFLIVKPKKSKAILMGSIHRITEQTIEILSSMDKLDIDAWIMNHASFTMKEHIYSDMFEKFSQDDKFPDIINKGIDLVEIPISRLIQLGFDKNNDSIFGLLSERTRNPDLRKLIDESFELRNNISLGSFERLDSE